MRYLIPALHDLGEMLNGRRVAPIELYEACRKSLHFVGYEGMSMIAVAGIDMAAWDALARAAGVPLCVLLGGSVGPVPAYNCDGTGLRSPAEVASEAAELRDEGGFRGLKLRLGRERLADDLATIEAVRDAVGSEMSLMVDFNQCQRRRQVASAGRSKNASRDSWEKAVRGCRSPGPGCVTSNSALQFD